MSSLQAIAGLNPGAGVPRLGLPRDTSYRVWPNKPLRLLRSERPPFGWYGDHALRSCDYSDCRYWEATDKDQILAVWEALHPTIREFENITKVQLSIRDMRCIWDGYEATYDELHWKLEVWVRENLGSDHEWVKNGKITKRLFKLDKWYGTMLDYMYAPNWPDPPKTGPPFNERLVQNPETIACTRCYLRNVLCHGHKENPRYICTPCLKSGLEKMCTKRQDLER